MKTIKKDIISKMSGVQSNKAVDPKDKKLNKYTPMVNSKKSLGDQIRSSQNSSSTWKIR